MVREMTIEGTPHPARPAATAVALTPDHLDRIAAAGVSTPTYDRAAQRPRLAHIGVGGFHRAHLAAYTHELACGGSDWRIRGFGILPNDIAMAQALRAQDGLYSLIEREDQHSTVTVIGSIVDYVFAPDLGAEPIGEATRQYGRRVGIAEPAARQNRAAASARTHPAQPFGDGVVAGLAEEDIAVVSLTVTEAGYDLAAGPGPAFGLIAAALDRRWREGTAPVTILSCDNLPGNGDAARVATLAAAGFHDDGLADWIDRNCTFPNSMVDRITPTTADADRHWLATEHGIVDRWPVVCEPFRQWVLEDHFANGRPAWHDVGAVFTDDVRSWELYKLRLLNAAHSSMAYLCSLAGLQYVDEAIAVPAVRQFLDTLLGHEAVPTLVPIAGHRPQDYVDTVLHRFANTGVRDQIARLCVDGTAKFPTFLVPTIDYQLANGGPVARSALALAGWARYLGTVPVAEQAADAGAGPARALAAKACADPGRFLDLDGVITPDLRNSERFRAAFVDGYRSLVDHGPLAAMGSAVDARPSTADPAV